MPWSPGVVQFIAYSQENPTGGKYMGKLAVVVVFLLLSCGSKAAGIGDASPTCSVTDCKDACEAYIADHVKSAVDAEVWKEIAEKCLNEKKRKRKR